MRTEMMRTEILWEVLVDGEWVAKIPDDPKPTSMSEMAKLMWDYPGPNRFTVNGKCVINVE